VALGTPSYLTAPPSNFLDIAIGGEYAAVRATKGGAPDTREWKRGNISTFSPRSRSRMLQKMAKTDTRSTPPAITFITLTYPDDWPEDRQDYKTDLDKWAKRLLREHPDCWALWRLEFQERGAPHFHFLIFGSQRIDWDWAKLAWTDITGDTSIAHYTYGCRVDPLTSWEDAGRYCAKYNAKVSEVAPPLDCGRCWGIRGAKNRRETVYRVRITEDEHYRIRRIMRRIINAPHGYYDRGGRRSGVWARIQNETAKRALEWATQARPSHPPEWIDPETGEIYGLGMLPGDIVLNSSVLPAGASQTKTVRTIRTNPDALYDEQDVQRARLRAMA